MEVFLDGAGHGVLDVLLEGYVQGIVHAWNGVALRLIEQMLYERHMRASCFANMDTA